MHKRRVHGEHAITYEHAITLSERDCVCLRERECVCLSRIYVSTNVRACLRACVGERACMDGGKGVRGCVSDSVPVCARARVFVCVCVCVY
jgi:hypothetical protein